ncbi:MAG: hypothetical protein AAF004_12300 [Pseudomonadota bacterium]
MMSRYQRIVLWIACGALLSTSANAKINLGQLQFNDRDWTVQRQGDESELRKGSGVLRISQPQPLSATPEQALKQLLVSAGGKSDWKVIPVSLVAGYDGLLSTGFTKAGKTRTYVAALLVYEGRQSVSITLVDVGNKGRNKLKQSFGRILKTLSIDGWKNENRNKRPPSDLAGFYVSAAETSAGSSSTSDAAQQGASGLWLTKSGHIVFTETAMAGDAKAYCKAYARQCSRYQYVNGSLTTTRVATKQLQKLQLRQRESRELVIDGKDLILASRRYRHVAPATGLRLNDRYQFVDPDSARGANGAAVGNATQVVYDFKPDGTFSRGEYPLRSNADDLSTGAVEADGRLASGNYKIEGFTIRLSYESGKTENKAFFLFDDVAVISGYPHQRMD